MAINISLSVTNINDLIKTVNGLHTDIENSETVVVKQLTKKGAEIGNLTNNIAPQSGLQKSQVIYRITDKGTKGYVALKGPSAVYDEFGTGTEGAKNAHPLKGQTTTHLNPYNSGPYIKRGEDGHLYWVYKPMAGKPYFDKKGHTQGIPSGKQMYTASTYVKFIKDSVIEKEFNSMINRIR